MVCYIIVPEMVQYERVEQIVPAKKAGTFT